MHADHGLALQWIATREATTRGTKVSEQNKKQDKSGLAIGGGVILGTGIGFFFFPVGVFGYTSVFAFTGCILAGLGVGMLISPLFVSYRNGD